MRVIITGAASGIGLAIAEAFAARGDEVALCDADEKKLAEIPSGLRGFRADVADEKDMAAFMDGAMKALGGVDILVSNAGPGGPQGDLETLPPDEWRQCLAAGAHGLFYAARAAIPFMKSRREGCIISISSNAGLTGLPRRSPYVAAKWALIGMTKCLAMELGPFGVRANAVCPGSVEGPRIDRVIAADAAVRGADPGEVRAEYMRQSSMRRFVTAGEVASLVLFLASPAGSAISGQALAVDGHTETLGAG